jgi:hypothetical protein
MRARNARSVLMTDSGIYWLPQHSPGKCDQRETAMQDHLVEIYEIFTPVERLMMKRHSLSAKKKEFLRVVGEHHSQASRSGIPDRKAHRNHGRAESRLRAPSRLPLSKE